MAQPSTTITRLQLPLEALSLPAWRVMFTVAVGLLLLAGGLASLVYFRFSAATEEVTQTYRVLARIDDLVARVVEAENGQRGYMLTRDSRFLQTYQDVRDESSAIADELTSLVADNPSQHMLARQLRTDVHTRLDELASVMLAFEAGRVDDINSEFDQGRQLMLRIRALAEDMRTAERGLLVQRANDVRLTRRAAWVFAALTIGLAMVLIGVGVALERTFRSRKAALALEADARHAVERINERLFDSSGDCLALLHPDGRMISMNRPGCDLMAIDTADVSGSAWPGLWGPTGILATQAVDDAIANGEARFVGTRPGPDNSVRWWDVVLTPIRDDAGQVVSLLAVSRDVTAQKRYEEELRGSEERFRTLSHALPQLVWSARGDGYMDYYNRRWYEYTGMPTPEEASPDESGADQGHGWRWKDYLHPEDLEPTLEAWTRSLISGDTYEAQYRIRRLDGAYRWFMGRALPMRDGSGTITRWVGSCTDIDNDKRAEEERAQLLASERAARSEAERAARLKDEFVSTLSHELRTPLNAVVGWVGVLKRDPTAENIAHGLDVIDRNLSRQTQMIDELLDMSRIVSGKMRLEVQQLDLMPVVEEAVSSATPAAEAKGVILETTVEPCPRVQGDPGRLQQIIWNLVNNAVKFTPRDGRVLVTLREERGQAVLEVRDTGIGIEPAFLSQIFQRFRQADASVTREHGGLGLGLAIVKSLVEMHGGSVEAESEGRGAGSVFRVLLPLAPEPERDTRSGLRTRVATPELDHVLQGLRVLVLDDEEDAREVAQWFLANAGADTTAVSSVDEALARIADGLVPDVIVSDIGMPGRDGFDFMQRVRQMSGPAARAPAAALTALARPEDRKRALLAGYQTHLPKPVDPAELVAVVASLAGRTGRPVT